MSEEIGTLAGNRSSNTGHESALNQIFKHYSIQHVNVGRTMNTFDNLKSQRDNMSLSDWLLFCRDFNVLSRNAMKAKVRVLHAKELSVLYKKHGRGKEVLGFDQFREMLIDLSNHMYPDEKLEQERFRKLWTFLGVAEPKSIREKMRHVGSPFKGIGPHLSMNDMEKTRFEKEKLDRMALDNNRKVEFTDKERNDEKREVREIQSVSDIRRTALKE